MARPAGIEPATPWFVVGTATIDTILNQYPATPANTLNTLRDASVSLNAACRVTFWLRQLRMHLATGYRKDLILKLSRIAAASIFFLDLDVAGVNIF